MFVSWHLRYYDYSSSCFQNEFEITNINTYLGYNKRSTGSWSKCNYLKSNKYLFKRLNWRIFFEWKKCFKVSLYKLIDGNWMLINESVTNSDGRCGDLLQREAYQSGRYKLHFAVEKYFKSIQTTTIYPFIEVHFFLLNFLFRFLSIIDIVLYLHFGRLFFFTRQNKNDLMTLCLYFLFFSFWAR